MTMAKTFTVLVTGGRTYRHPHRVYRKLDELKDRHGNIRIIEGGAAGADSWARVWARKNMMPCLTVRADWSRGKRAGPERNAKMLTYDPNVVLAFPGGRGTANMIKQAKGKGKIVVEMAE